MTLNHNFPIKNHRQNFDVVMFLLSNLVTGPSFVLISFLVLELWQFLFEKDLTWNPEIGNTSVWVLSNFSRLGWVKDTKFGVNVSNKNLLNAAKHQAYCFYRFWVIKWEINCGNKYTPLTYNNMQHTFKQKMYILDSSKHVFYQKWSVTGPV